MSLTRRCLVVLASCEFVRAGALDASRLLRQGPPPPTTQQILDAAGKVIKEVDPFVGHSGAIAVRLPSDKPSAAWGADKARTVQTAVYSKDDTQAGAFAMAGTDTDKTNRLLFGGAYKGYKKEAKGPDLPPASGLLGYVGTGPHMVEGVVATPGKTEGVDHFKLKVEGGGEEHLTKEQVKEQFAKFFKK
mmetsp:Transcript_74457/g.168684  ORF Transcript_74457/g.168684 Transcript_74457/m.168684 type:complete len:189 (-) Transcript_74457:68-634(-)|eukprot:CAMPEP_0197880652 /NCGR_PEP_ID=MMETSP1439-20131203/8390_1 /TAXON_ID=66791 /ORGANISM="Gonyaulax spinifera, Strain CCMP409" /LENGTH=188 /DNA_ID=CAMNT_0043500215 /DNA_START=60 /DNA_END=626 /DNA_ORIENTATION=-